MSLVYLDTETTGLDPMKHDVWEIAYAVDGGEIQSAFLPMDRFHNADVNALIIGGFDKRFQAPVDQWATHDFDNALRQALSGNTLVGANPAFDAAFLQYAWWQTHENPKPWKYRLFDIEAYAMGALGYDVPQGIKRISDDLRDKGYDIPAPDHTAAGDVAALRACHLALIEEYRS